MDPAQPSGLPCSVTLASASPSWESLLDSEGIAWKSPADCSNTVPSVVVLPDDAPRAVRQRCLQWGRQGAGMVLETTDLPCTDPPERWVLPYHARTFAGLADGSPDATTVDIGSLGEGTCYRLGLSLDAVWPDHRVGDNVVLMAPGGPEVRHRHVCLARGNLRRVVRSVMRRAFHDRNLPLVHTWYWPGTCRTAFLLRGDMDAGSTDEMAAFLAAVEPFAGNTTLSCFAGAYQDKIDLLSRIVSMGIELCNHTFTHFVFPDGPRNQRNLERAQRLLETAGASVRGAVAPAWFWHPSYHRVMEETGYAYASCFGLAHDDLPFFPVVRRGVSRVLEIPFHCVGDFMPKFGMGLDDPRVREFFDRLVAAKHAAADPICLYGHPDVPGRLGSQGDLVRHICHHALSLPDVWSGQMSQLADWWVRRGAFKADCFYDRQAELLVCRPAAAVESQADPPHLAVHCPDGTWGLIRPQTGNTPLAAIERRPPLTWPAATGTGQCVHRPPAIGWRLRLRRWRRERRRLAEKHRMLYRS